MSDFNFKVGQEIVCICSKEVILPLNGLTEGTIYEVEYCIASIDGVVLVGMTSGHPLGAYHKGRFKPLEEESISIEEVEYIENMI